MGSHCVRRAVERLVADGAHEWIRINNADETSAPGSGVDDGAVEANGVWRADVAV